MARSKLGVVAGAGVIAAVLLIGDPGAAVAVADRGGSISPHFGGGNRSDDGDKRGVLNRGGGDQRNLGGVFGGKRGIVGKLPDLKPDIPRTTVESNTSDTARDKRDANRENLGVSRETLAATTPSSNSRVTVSANDLKPDSSSLVSFMRQGLGRLVGQGRCAAPAPGTAK